MKIIITGGSGLLGQYLNITLSKENEILTLYNGNKGNCKDFPSLKVDIADSNKMRSVFDEFPPDVVIHSAAVSSPAFADLLPAKKVYEINVSSTKNIADLCKSHNSKIIYTSTDLVYAGYRVSMLAENAKLIPASLHAETKLVGEKKIMEVFDNYVILRLALLIGFGLNHSTNHFQKMYNDFKSGREVKLFSDQFRTPLSVIEAARIISELIKLNIKGEIINLGGKERLSRMEIGERLCEVEGFAKSLIIKTSMNEIPGTQQVADVSLNTSKIQSFGIKLKNFDESLLQILHEKY